MKKALVIALIFVLGLGFAAFATGVLSGDWDTDISLYPAASEFSGFIKSFTSEVDVDYTIGGWVFGVESTFGLAGLTGMDFNADGVLGAFTFEGNIDFAPMILKAKTITLVYTIGTVTCAGHSYTDAITFTTKTETSTYGAGFDDAFLETSVSIAGVNLGVVFALEGEDNEFSEPVTAFHATGKPSANVKPAQSGSVTIADTTTYGTGWKFSASGSFGGATLTGLAYFNLGEYSTYADNAGYANVYLADKFTKSGTYYVICPDCVFRFTSLDIVLEDVSFACASINAMVSFDCCGFTNAMFLIEDIGLGCCWDLGFDMLITFDADSKTIALEPDITLANSCFTLIAAIDADTTSTDFSLNGIDIRGIGLEYSWNGITFEANTSFDLSHNPLLGSYLYGGIVYSPNKFWIWEPDRDKSAATYSTTTGLTTISAYAISMTNASGWYQLKSYNCERAKAWEEFKITVDGDSCCGGDFDISAATYLGEVEYLSALYGLYWADENGDGDYDSATSGWAAADDEYILFYGTLPTPTATALDPTAPTLTAYSSTCNKTQCGTTATQEYDEVEYYETWTAKTDNRLFDWIETDVDVVMGIGSNFDLTFGMDLTCWGWEDFTFGFEFTF